MKKLTTQAMKRPIRRRKSADLKRIADALERLHGELKPLYSLHHLVVDLKRIADRLEAKQESPVSPSGGVQCEAS